jgi:nucleotide-binding universal stress UspA family protein
MKTILVATDFSPAAYNAAKYAAEMAAVINADVFLLHVFQLPISYSEVPLTVTEDDVMQQAEIAMDDLKEKLIARTADKININSEVRMGVFFRELQTVCERIMPYTVVMGSQGSTATDRLLFGGHTVYAMMHLLWPLITVPIDASFSAIKKIGLACDFDKVIDTTPVDEISRLVNDFTAELHILNTGKQREFDPDIVFQSGLMQEMLEELKPDYHFITHDNTDQGIMDFAEKNNIDLLVILPKRHGLFESLVHKSHTKQMVLHSHVPVMALHQHEG